MAGRLDRYVVKTLVGSYVGALVIVVFIYILFDLLLNFGRYMGVAEANGISFAQVLGVWSRYHMVSVPWLYVTSAPFLTVVAGMFAVSKLMAANEVVPMVFTGRSMYRVLRPVFVLGGLSALTMAGIWQWGLPVLNPEIDRLSRLLDKGDFDAGVERPVLSSPDDPKLKLFCRRYLHDRQRIEGLDMVRSGVVREDAREVKAVAAVWDAERQDWELEQGFEHSIDSIEPRQFLGMRGLTPQLLQHVGKESKLTSLLSYTDLLQLQTLRPGQPAFVVAFHTHFTFPLANLVLLLLAVPFAVFFERGGKTARVAMSIVVCALYLIVDLICQNLGFGEHVHPVVAAWTPTILFGSFGAVMFAGIRT